MTAHMERDQASTPTDIDFFSRYDWCLNPILTLKEMRQRLEQELDQNQAPAPSWQREEVLINIYILLCAATCTVDDYLARRALSLRPVARQFPRLSGVISASEACLNFVPRLFSFRHKRLVCRWRRQIEGAVDAVCDLLASGSAPGDIGIGNLHALLGGLLRAPLPPQALASRMRIPEAYRCQDLTHHDVLAMAERINRICETDSRPVVVVGPRTAGSYFAPLVCAHLRKGGRAVAGWTTVRPKDGLTASERKWVRQQLRTPGLVVVVDDHPNTGNTFSLMAAGLYRLGARPENILMLAPDHPAQSDWARLVRPIRSVTLPEPEFHKRRLLDNASAMTRLMRDLYRARGWDDARIVERPLVEAVNARLWGEYEISFQVRLKRLFEVELRRRGGKTQAVRVLAKSVGWGWLGYHAALAGIRLAGFVPGVIGLRQGILFSEWKGGLDGAHDSPQPAQIAAAVPAYLAARVRRLRLPEDSSLISVGSRYTGWDLLVDALRRPYGRYIGRLQTRRIRRQLKMYRSSVPTLVDGQMGLENWVQGEHGIIYKADFEHHNFGGGELDLVDPAFDLASAIHHLGLGEEEEQNLIASYVQASGDLKVRDRLLLFKLISGLVGMERALYRLSRNPGHPSSEDWNRLYIRSRDFLTFHTHRHFAAEIGKPHFGDWSDRLFFLDLDGVFDLVALFGQFPQTTPKGLLALRLLQLHGYSVVPTTARSVSQVRDYCRGYRFPGGVAEYGCVFIDAAAGRELPLVADEAREQLLKCGDLIRNLPGVFRDPTYEWAVRAYRYHAKGTEGLKEQEVLELLNKSGLSKLRCIATKEDTYILPREVDKGRAVRKVIDHLGSLKRPIVAMGDSYEDLEMLKAADIAYMPANCCEELRGMGRRPRFHLVRQPVQRGLLEAVGHLIGTRAANHHRDRQELGSPTECADNLINLLTRAADQPRYIQLLNCMIGRLS
jgi:HAD superfamily hydrolase (TIGR01484 family)